MSITVIDPNQNGNQRLIESGADGASKLTKSVSSETPLSKRLLPGQLTWLYQYASDRWNACHNSLSSWRSKMVVWEKQSEMNYSDRVGKNDPNNPETLRDVFSYQNETLGTADGFVDFFTAQGRDDIFATKPWLAATPEGRSDSKLADLITKHANWKLNQTPLEQAAKDAIRVTGWGGTAFLKSRWDRQEESYESVKKVAFSISGKAAILDPQSKDFIDSEEVLEQMGIDGDDVEWRDQEVENLQVIYDNTRTELIDFKDIAFDSKASELDLCQTDVFCRFRMGLLDLMAHFEIDPALEDKLRNALIQDGEGVRAERGESSNTGVNVGGDEKRANPPVSLIEGFLRCDPLRTGKPIRIHMIFSLDLNMIIKVDYLANVSPGGELPIFPVRINKIPGRILGIGYYEKYEDANNSVDRQYNAMIYRNKLAANVISAFQPDALTEDSPRDFTIDTAKPFILAQGKTINDLIDFKVIPDSNNRANEIMNQRLQMMQMQSGITSAAQGELKGVPSANTATGTNDIISRGAILLKDPITELTTDINKVVSYNVMLIYAHQDADETFAWGEGEASELLTIKAGDVRDLQMNVTLNLVQAQNQQKYQNAQAGITICTNYSKLPEIDKGSCRQLYVQSLSSLGFVNSEDMLRQPVVDPEGILAIIPPDIQPIVAQALIDAGVMAPEAPTEEVGEGTSQTDAPVPVTA